MNIPIHSKDSSQIRSCQITLNEAILSLIIKPSL